MRLIQAANCPAFEELRYPVVASPKLDGIRGIKRNGKLWSRREKLIPNLHIQKMAEQIPEGFEGEIVVDMKEYRVNASAIMSRGGEPDFKFFVFDICLPVWEFAPFHNRVTHFREECFRIDNGWLRPMPHCLIDTPEKLWELFMSWGAQYEGLVIRDPAGRYKRGRSTVKEQLFLKKKPMDDSEGVVIEQLEEVDDVQRLKGRLGALKCRMHGDVIVKVGTGFTAEEREAFWQNPIVGRTIAIRHQGVGPDGVPRFPSFKGLRDD